MKNRLVRLTILSLAVAGIGLVGAASPAAAADVCYVTVHPHVYPGVIWDEYNGVGVETGEYHVHQNCVSAGA